MPTGFFNGAVNVDDAATSRTNLGITSGIGGSSGSTDQAIITANGTGGSTVQGSVAIVANTTGALTISAANSGAVTTHTLKNTSNNAGAGTRLSVQCGGSSADADAAIDFQVSGVTTWTAGVDNSVSDNFVVAASATLGSSNILSMTTTGYVGIGATSTSNLLVTRPAAETSGATIYEKITPAADTGLTASTEVPLLNVNSSAQSRQWSTGTLALQRDTKLEQPTYAFVGASTLTNAATIGVVGAPIAGTNATITNSHSMLVSAGAVSGTVTRAYGLSVNSPTGATTNYCAVFVGNNADGKAVGIGTTVPSGTLVITRSAAASSGAIPYLLITPASDSGLSNAEVPIIKTDSNTTSRSWTNGTLALQRDVAFTQPLYSSGSAKTMTDVCTLGIEAGPSMGSNLTGTNIHGILIQGASVVGSGAGTNSYGLTVNAQSGATNNYCAQFIGGAVGIGTASPNASALLDVQSTTKGLRLPNMTTTQRDAISSPGAGLMIYNTTTAKINVYTTTWEAVTSI